MKSENTDDNNSTFYFVNKATDACIVIKISKQLQLRSSVARGFKNISMLQLPLGHFLIVDSDAYAFFHS